MAENNKGFSKDTVLTEKKLAGVLPEPFIFHPRDNIVC